MNTQPLDERLKEAQEKLDALYDELIDFLNGLMIKDEELTRGHIKICLQSIMKDLDMMSEVREVG